MMTSRERMLAPLNGEFPDRVPYFEIVFSQEVARKHTGENREFTEQEISKLFGRDNITHWIGPPVFAQIQEGSGEEHWVGEGLIRVEADLDKMELPELNDEFFGPAAGFLKERGEYAACAAIGMGIDPTIKSMGFENFCLSIYDNPDFLLKVLRKFTAWSAKAARMCCELGFDFLWIYEDIASGHGTFFSPEVFEKLLLPEIAVVADAIEIPWIFHSDGNLNKIMDPLLGLGMNGLHPIEALSMDAEKLKEEYGDRVVLVGNIDIVLLSDGTPTEVSREAKRLVETLGRGGGYIASSCNAITAACKPENVIAFSEALRRYGRYKDGEIQPLNSSLTSRLFRKVFGEALP